MKKTLFILMAALPLIFVSCDGKQNTDNPGTDVPGGETPGGSESPDKSSSLGIHALDLGLSVEWADKNLGAKEATAAGDYFAWGETKSKDIFKWETYKFGAVKESLNKYNASDGLTVLQPGDDAATQILGGKWRMPTTKEWQDLRSKCKWTWVSKDNVYGAEGTVGDVTIFLPAGGGMNSTTLHDFGNYGFYWTANCVDGDASSAWSFYVRNMEVSHMDFPRGNYGLMVRAVRDKE